jgi:hypothetical protein
MGCMDRCDHMMTWGRMRRLFFHLQDLTILSSSIIFAFSGSKLLHWLFRLTLETDLSTRGMKSVSTWDLMTRKTSAIHQPAKKTWWKIQQTVACWRKIIQCCVCCAQNEETGTKFKCPECDVALCARPCFDLFHTKLYFLRLTVNWKIRADRYK